MTTFEDVRIGAPTDTLLSQSPDYAMQTELWEGIPAPVAEWRGRRIKNGAWLIPPPPASPDQPLPLSQRNI